VEVERDEEGDRAEQGDGLEWFLSGGANPRFLSRGDSRGEAVLGTSRGDEEREDRQHVHYKGCFLSTQKRERTEPVQRPGPPPPGGGVSWGVPEETRRGNAFGGSTNGFSRETIII